MSDSTDLAFAVNGTPVTDIRRHLEEQVAKLTAENARLQTELARTTQMWERDKMVMDSLIREAFPETEEELLAQAKTLPTLAEYIADLEREMAGNA
jgi:hypothetical protein